MKAQVTKYTINMYR